MRGILTYHSIDGSGSPISVDSETFARHVAFLASGRVRVVSLRELIFAAPAAPAVAVTFDDGFVNFATDAWPRLRDAGLPVTVFVVSHHVGRDNAWGGQEVRHIPTLPLLGWDDVARLASEGVTVGCHSRTHPSLDRLPKDRVLDEVFGCRDDILRRTGSAPWAFCYPYGHWSVAVRDTVAEVYEAACTTELRTFSSKDDPWALPRLDAFYLRCRGQLECFGSAAFARRVAWRRVLRSVRGSLSRRLRVR